MENEPQTPWGEPALAWVVRALFNPEQAPLFDPVYQTMSEFDRWMMYRNAPTMAIREQLRQELDILEVQIMDNDTMSDLHGPTNGIVLAMTTIPGIWMTNGTNKRDLKQWYNFHRPLLQHGYRSLIARTWHNGERVLFAIYKIGREIQIEYADQLDDKWRSPHHLQHLRDGAF